MMAVADSQTAATALQEALNQRAAPRGYPPLNVDGILGPVTKMAVQDLGHALGIEPELLAAEQLAPEVLQLFVDPKSRTTAEVLNAGERAGGLEAREIELDEVKLAWGLVKPLVRARAAGWEGSLEAVVSHSELLERLFEGASAWWHKVIEASNEGQLESILTEMGYACELVAHASGVLGRSGLRFVEQPGAVEPGAAVAGSAPGRSAPQDPPAASQPPAGTSAPPEPTAPSQPPAGTAVPPEPTAPSQPPAGTAVSPEPTAPSATTAAVAITGPDVSASQGAIDWNAVAAAGHGFAFIRATSGVSTVDERFASNWKGAGAAGLRRGAYHVAAPEAGRDPGDEAVNLVSAIRAVGAASDADLPPSAAIDDLANTFSSEQVRDWLRAFSAVFERITQQLPAIRMSANSFARALGSDASTVRGPIWLSGATSPTQTVASLASFEPLSDDAGCPGVDGPCQLSRFAGSQVQFDQLRGGTPPTT
jgi:lysozyme